jgi:hypothetical protein
MPLGNPSQLRQPLQAVMPRHRVIPAMPSLNLIRHIPKKLETHCADPFKQTFGQRTLFHLTYSTWIVSIAENTEAAQMSAEGVGVMAVTIARP